MEKFKVIDPNGISHNGETFKKGDVIVMGRGAALNAFVHFGQVKPTSDAKAEDSEPESKKPHGK